MGGRGLFFSDANSVGVNSRELILQENEQEIPNCGITPVRELVLASH